MGPVGFDYSAAVLDHFRNPRNCGEIPDAEAVGEAVNPACGDRMRISLRIEGKRIEAARFKAFGCIAAIAASSKLTEMLTGRTLDEAKALTNREVADALGGLPEGKTGCSVLAEQGLRAALEDFERRQRG
jgi:nitrogen fixation protein NifU and related proteins